MRQQVKKSAIGCTALENMSVPLPLISVRIENMAEQVCAQFLQKIVLRFKVGVKGCPAHIRPLNDLAHGDPAEILAG